jgi:hypothetical protein
MSSSWLIKKRKEMDKWWNINNFGTDKNALGGWEDSYIINGAIRECHPNYEAVPIGNPYGFMICRRRKDENGKGLDVPSEEIHPSEFNGYNKYMADMYRPWRKTQIQTYNPTNYYDRTTPNQEELHLRDYLAREIQFNSTGIKPTHTPGPRKYYEYGYSFTNGPPFKYDITRLHQGYPSWRKDKLFHGIERKILQELDENFHDKNTHGNF